MTYCRIKKVNNSGLAKMSITLLFEILANSFTSSNPKNPAPPITICRLAIGLSYLFLPTHPQYDCSRNNDSNTNIPGQVEWLPQKKKSPNCNDDVSEADEEYKTNIKSERAVYALSCWSTVNKPSKM